MDSRLQHLEELVTRLARSEILPRFLEPNPTAKKDGSLVTEADSVMQQRIFEELDKKFSNIKLLGEEMNPAEQQALLDEGKPLWCLDPLDGTTNFAAGLPIFSVSLALIEKGVPVLGLIYDPIRGECFTAVAGQGAWLNGLPLRVTRWEMGMENAVAVVDFKRLKPDLASKLVSDPPYRSQRNLGTCALEWAWLAAGRFQMYLHGGQKLWDHAAGVLIASEAGACIKTVEGETVMADKLDPCPVLAATDEDLWQHWKAEIE